MYISKVQVRVRYADTDRMGYLYHGHYPAYYEIGRTEALRNIGIIYKELEDSGIMMPVIEMNIKYIKPVHYDTLLTIETLVNELPEVRIKFNYKLLNEDNVLMNEAKTILIFFDSQKQKPCRVPDNVLNQLKQYFG